MSRLPDAVNLLLTAHAAVIEKLLPALPTTLHYEARMIARAMVVAAREIDHSHGDERLDEGSLASAIRAGLHDQGTARGMLLALTRKKLEVSNPGLLGCYGHLEG